MHSWEFLKEKNEQPDVLFLWVCVHNLVHTHTDTHAFFLTSSSLGVLRNNSQGILVSLGV